MTIFDDPNRESVGLEPIWTGADTGAAEEPEVAPLEADTKTTKTKRAADTEAPPSEDTTTEAG